MRHGLALPLTVPASKPSRKSIFFLEKEHFLHILRILIILLAQIMMMFFMVILIIIPFLLVLEMIHSPVVGEKIPLMEA